MVVNYDVSPRTVIKWKKKMIFRASLIDAVGDCRAYLQLTRESTSFVPTHAYIYEYHILFSST